MIRYVDQITSEEYMNLRKMVGWVQFPLEEAQACIDNAYMVLCVRDDGKAIGVVRLLWDGGYIAFLSDVIVDPSYQGQGIGRKLFSMACEEARRLGAEKLYISSHSSKESQAAYRALGCTHAKEINARLVAEEPFDVQLEYRL